MENEFNNLCKVGEDFKRVLGWDKLSDDEVIYKIIETIKGKEIVDKWLENNKEN